METNKKNPQTLCHHQTSDSNDRLTKFNFCPWCGKKLTIQFSELTKLAIEDCIKGGCED